MEIKFTKNNLECAYLAYAIFIGVRAIFGFQDITLSAWPVWACLAMNVAFLYILVSIVGYYWQNYTLRELLRHFWDLFSVVGLSAYFIINQIIQPFVKGLIPFTYLVP